VTEDKGSDLTVEQKPIEIVQELSDQEEKELKDIPLPKIGTKFMITGQEYEVCYINEGRCRFSARPCKGIY